MKRPVDLVEVRLAVVDLDPGHVDVPAQAGVDGQLVGDAEVVLQVEGVFRPRLGVGLGVEQVARLRRRVAEQEAGHVEAGGRVDGAAAAWPAQFEVWLLLNPKLPTMVSAFRISRERSVTLPPAFSVWRPFSQVTLSKNWKSFWLVISGWLLLAPRFRMFWNAELRHRRRRLVQVDAGDADRRRRVGPVVDRRHEELDLVDAEAELVQPARAERVGVVERHALRVDVALAGAERRARVAVRQRRRQRRAPSSGCCSGRRTGCCRSGRGRP